jgi:hypothetical protein
MKRTALLITVALLLAACHRDGRPADVMDHGQMVAFLTEAYMLEGFYAVETQYRYDSLLPEVVAAYDDILTRQDLSRKKVEKSLKYYASHPAEYQIIHDSVLAILDAENNVDDSKSAASIVSYGLD